VVVCVNFPLAKKSNVLYTCCNNYFIEFFVRFGLVPQGRFSS
jgi:hypothetical protein